MKEVAIIDLYDMYGYDNFNKIVNSITDWSVVSDEDFALLRKAVARKYELTLIERKDRDEKFIPTLIADYIKLEKAEQEQEEKEKAERERRREANALKKKAKTEANEKKLLVALLEKHGST